VQQRASCGREMGDGNDRAVKEEQIYSSHTPSCRMCFANEDG
jgi:hypothetical protein